MEGGWTRLVAPSRSEMTTKKRLLLTVDGKHYDVLVEDDGVSSATVVVNGKKIEVDVREQAGIGQPNAAPVVGETPRPVQAEESQKKVQVGGGVVRQVRAPMPGTISSIEVRPHQQIAKGDALCHLEAMKMDNAIHAPEAGIIIEVLVVISQTVKNGEVLVVYESR